MRSAATAVVEHRFETISRPVAETLHTAPAQPERRVTRRPSREQGQALEVLGHAIEYLIDSRLFLSPRYDPRSERQAVQLLMRLNRAVFADCPESVSVWDRIGGLCRRSFARR